MKVLLTEDIETLGYSGEVHDVAPGYARNYLIPRGMAVKATPGVLKSAESWRKRAEARRAEIRREHEALVERLDDLILTFTAKAGEQGKLYGSITTANIADEINRELGIELDRRKIDSQALRQIGEHQVPVVLSREYRAHVTVNIHPESGETEGEEEEAAETEAVLEQEGLAEEMEAEMASPAEESEEVAA